jgi:hypothetical protein
MGQQMILTNCTGAIIEWKGTELRNSWLQEAQTFYFLTANNYGESFEFHRL